MEDSVDGINDGSEEAGIGAVDDDKSDENDAEYESLENEQNGEYFPNIKSKELMRNSNCEHFPSQILRNQHFQILPLTIPPEMK